jgi:hypothetical protein
MKGGENQRLFKKTTSYKQSTQIKEVIMKTRGSNRQTVKRVSLVAAGLLTFLCAFIILSQPSWAEAKGTVSILGTTEPGHDVDANIIAPNTGGKSIAVRFDQVTRGGITKAKRCDPGIHESPSPFRLHAPAAFFNIETTAEYNGPIDICIDYSGMGYDNESALKISHLKDKTWEELQTVLDKENDIICGRASSLSHFAVYEDPKLVYGPYFWYHRVR